ncbi:alpha/beta fold hydrolase [Agromyces aureus]|uniref:Alpha/beta hydrolase n=1 Tax=Agromyces aureus TaxID=453304 RepID=A0A191WL73_9MICO|nr:alpha/beta hydrolase [Agromyces aureus]ANJ28923.1 alpha/beta hydrolase [Agromyces aureus]
MDQHWTASGVRMRLRHERPGELDWLLLPGGPGIGSESLHELADVIDVPGRVWMVDLPGDGSNVDAPGAPVDPFTVWPSVLIEAAAAVAHPIFVGHSTGGMYLLSTPELEGMLTGLVLVSTAPDASWMGAFEQMTRDHPLPEVDAATVAYELEPTDGHLADFAVASAPWNFRADHVERGRELLARMPYNGRAVDWSAEHFDTTYAANWWPQALPTLIVSGGDDRIVTQRLWNVARYEGPNVTRADIEGGAHFAWIEEPGQVRAAFAEFARSLPTEDAPPAT